MAREREIVFTSFNVLCEYARDRDVKDREAELVGELLESDIDCHCVDWPGEARYIGQHHPRCRNKKNDDLYLTA